MGKKFKQIFFLHFFVFFKFTNLNLLFFGFVFHFLFFILWWWWNTLHIWIQKCINLSIYIFGFIQVSLIIPTYHPKKLPIFSFFPLFNNTNSGLLSSPYLYHPSCLTTPPHCCIINIANNHFVLIWHNNLYIVFFGFFIFIFQKLQKKLIFCKNTKKHKN